MTRRIPPALGIVVVISAVYGLHSVAPMVGMMVRDDDSELHGIVALLAGTGLAQLLTGLAIAIGWAHARLALLGWTLAAIATAIFARDLFAGGEPNSLVIISVEMLAGPAIVWIVPLFVGDIAPLPAIPPARIVSSDSDVGARATSPVDPRARRADVGVVLFGLGLAWILGAVLTRAVTFLFFARASNAGVGMLFELVWLAHAVAVGALALRAARHLLDPAIDVRSARSALFLYVAVDIGGDILRTSIAITVQLVTGDLSSDIMKMLMAQWIISAVLGLVVPGFLWFYARAALSDRSPDASDGRDATTAPILTAVPAWAVLWFAPLLLARPLIAGALDVEGASSVVLVFIAIACGVQGIVHVVASIAAFIAHRDERARPVARIAALVGVAGALALMVCWGLVVFGMEPYERFGQQTPIWPLVQLFACTATLWWALRKR